MEVAKDDEGQRTTFSNVIKQNFKPKLSPIFSRPDSFIAFNVGGLSFLQISFFNDVVVFFVVVVKVVFAVSWLDG